MAQVVRRVGTPPNRRAGCSDASNCPDVLELDTGDFAIIGTAVENLTLPPGAEGLPAGRLVVVPRAVLVDAARDLLGSV